MIKCSGKSVLKGIAIGRIYLYKKQEYVLKQETMKILKRKSKEWRRRRKPQPNSWRSFIRRP